MAETFWEKKQLPRALPWSQIKHSRNHFRMSYETERHFKKTHFDTEIRCSLAGFARIKASGENTVRGNTETMPWHGTQAYSTRGHWAGLSSDPTHPILSEGHLALLGRLRAANPPPSPLPRQPRPQQAAKSTSRRCCCHDHEGFQGVPLGPCRKDCTSVGGQD